MSDCISDQPLVPKFANPGNHFLIVFINNIPIENYLIDLGAAIYIMSMGTLRVLQLHIDLIPTPTILELADKSMVKPVGALDDIIVTVTSWEYPLDFLVLKTEYPIKEHP